MPCTQVCVHVSLFLCEISNFLLELLLVFSFDKLLDKHINMNDFFLVVLYWVLYTILTLLVTLVCMFQARNNARILITGSLSVFSNRYPIAVADAIFKCFMSSVTKYSFPCRLFRSEVQKGGSLTKWVSLQLCLPSYYSRLWCSFYSCYLYPGCLCLTFPCAAIHGNCLSCACKILELPHLFMLLKQEANFLVSNWWTGRLEIHH